jgi:hypothetical protein
MLNGHDGFFGGIHAANGRAVIVVLVPASNALQEGDPFWAGLIRGPPDMATGWSAGREHALILESGDNVGVAAETVFLGQLRLVDLVAWGEYDGANIQVAFRFHHVMIDCILAAGEDTGHTL